MRNVATYSSLILGLMVGGASACRPRVNQSQVQSVGRVSGSNTSLRAYVEAFQKGEMDFETFRQQAGAYLKSIQRYPKETPYSDNEIARYMDQGVRVMNAQKKIATINGDARQVTKFDLLDGEDAVTYTKLLPAPYQNRQGFNIPFTGGGPVANSRVFHNKSHGCAEGYLELDASRDSSVRVGMFEGNEKLPFVVRFSNGVGTLEHDAKPDVRGVAMKFWNADKYGSEFNTWDMTMTNSPVPFGKDQEQFVQFLEASMDPRTSTGGSAKLVAFVLKNLKSDDPRIAGAGHWLLRRTTRAIFMDSLADEVYWSGNPYMMGEGKAAKLILKPTEMKSDRLFDDLDNRLSVMATKEYEKANGSFESNTKNLLLTLRSLGLNVDKNISLDWWEMRRDLDHHFNAGKTINFDLYAQFDQTSDTETFENGLYVWEGPLTKIGRIVMEHKVEDKFCESLSFNPGRIHAAHRPLTDFGRGRIFTYMASAAGRHATLSDPDWSEVQKHIVAPLQTDGTFTAGKYPMRSLNTKNQVYCSYPNYDKNKGYAISTINFAPSSDYGETQISFRHTLMGWTDPQSPKHTVTNYELDPYIFELNWEAAHREGWTSWPTFTTDRIVHLMNNLVVPKTRNDGKWAIDYCWKKEGT